MLYLSRERMGWWGVQVYLVHRGSQETEGPMDFLGKEECQVPTSNVEG